MDDRASKDVVANRTVDVLDGPGPRHSRRRRAVTVGVLAMLVGGVGATLVLTHHPHRGSEAAQHGTPVPADPRLHRQRTPATVDRTSSAGDISATGRIEGTLSPGDILVFDVTLQSSRTFSLHPCPSYSITFGRQVTTGRLSCGQVPYLASLVRPDGGLSGFQPVLPAGTDLAFRMRVQVPDQPGLRQVVWTLHGTRPRPVLSGVVQVTGAGAG